MPAQFTCCLSVAMHPVFAFALLNDRPEKPGIGAPPATAISVNLAASDILNAPEDARQHRAAEETRRRGLHADEWRRLKREAGQRDDDRQCREQAEIQAQDEARKRRQSRQEQNAAKGSQCPQRSVGRASASRGSVISDRGILNAYMARRQPANAGGDGRAMVSFGVLPPGGLFFVRVARPSGDPAIDRTAIAGMRRAAPFPHPPQGMSDQERMFQISLRFR